MSLIWYIVQAICNQTLDSNTTLTNSTRVLLLFKIYWFIVYTRTYNEKSHILFTSLCSIFNGTEMDRNIRIIFTSGLDFFEAVQRMHIYLLFGP
jgi:hypothetical protein